MKRRSCYTAAAATTKLTATVATSDPLFPVIKSGYVVAGVLGVVVTFTVAPVAVASVDEVAVGGSPVTVKVTGPLNPAIGTILIS